MEKLKRENLLWGRGKKTEKRKIRKWMAGEENIGKVG
jgi:hypothetical protein